MKTRAYVVGRLLPFMALFATQATPADLLTVTTYPDSLIIDKQFRISHDTMSKVSSQERREPDSGKISDFELLGGNLPKILQDHGKPYLVTSDIFVPSGKTIRIEPGAVLLFKNFTGMHVEGRLIAEGTLQRPIVFSSEFDHSYNPHATLHANPYDWNGIYIHENGIGSSFAYSKLQYAVFGINSLTKYIKLEKTFFSNNGRSDISIEGKELATSSQPYSYALTLDDARKDGIPVKVLMDPHVKKRNLFRYGGLSLFAGGCIAAVWSAVQFNRDQQRMNLLSDTTISGPNSNLFKNRSADWQQAHSSKNLDIALSAISISVVILGGAGFGISFSF
jgi:hypothetical protein